MIQCRKYILLDLGLEFQNVKDPCTENLNCCKCQVVGLASRPPLSPLLPMPQLQGSSKAHDIFIIVLQSYNILRLVFKSDHASTEGWAPCDFHHKAHNLEKPSQFISRSFPLRYLNLHFEYGCSLLLERRGQEPKPPGEPIK